jgi:hypothetical protein
LQHPAILCERLVSFGTQVKRVGEFFRRWVW